jgi:hypothetical protein
VAWLMPPGALEVRIPENAIARMKDLGITPINWTTIAAELQLNWSLPTGKDLGRVFHDHYHWVRLLISFEYKTANVLQKAS